MVATAQLLALDQARRDKQAELDAMVDRLTEWLLPLPESESSPDGRFKDRGCDSVRRLRVWSVLHPRLRTGSCRRKLAVTTQASVQFLTHVIGQVRDPAPAHPYRWETAFPNERSIEARRKAGEALIALKDQLAPGEAGRFGGKRLPGSWVCFHAHSSRKAAEHRMVLYFQTLVVSRHPSTDH